MSDCLGSLTSDQRKSAFIFNAVDKLQNQENTNEGDSQYFQYDVNNSNFDIGPGNTIPDDGTVTASYISGGANAITNGVANYVQGINNKMTNGSHNLFLSTTLTINNLPDPTNEVILAPKGVQTIANGVYPNPIPSN